MSIILRGFFPYHKDSYVISESPATDNYDNRQKKIQTVLQSAIDADASEER